VDATFAAGGRLSGGHDDGHGTGFGTTGASPEIRVFTRIPFAAPAVGATRWRPPQAVVNVTSEAATVPAAATLAFFALAYQQLLKGGAHQ
jgi:carboxylesterase type B